MKKLFEKWTDNQNIEKRRELLTAVSFNKWIPEPEPARMHEKIVH